MYCVTYAADEHGGNIQHYVNVTETLLKKPRSLIFVNHTQAQTDLTRRTGDENETVNTESHAVTNY